MGTSESKTKTTAPIKMKYFALFAILALGLAQAAPATDVWELFKTVHKKSYETEAEELLRKEIFLNNVQKVEEHNQKFEAGEVSFKLGVNQFSDLIESEFRASQLGFKKPAAHKSGASGMFVADAGVELPTSVDWRKKGAVTAVKNQGQCGSCWSFSTTGSVEVAHAIKTGNLVSLSEEQLVECSWDQGNQGCNGGLMDSAFKYIIEAPGLESEHDYPYTSGGGHSGHDCKFDKSKVKATISSYVDVKHKDEDALKQAVATVGPISVAIDAGHLSFQLYSGGVYYERNCSEDRLDHGVLVVGYGTEDGKDYWLVKNSWLPAGEKKVTSRWPGTRTTTVVLPPRLLTPLSKYSFKSVFRIERKAGYVKMTS